MKTFNNNKEIMDLTIEATEIVENDYDTPTYELVTLQFAELIIEKCIQAIDAKIDADAEKDYYDDIIGLENAKQVIYKKFFK